MTDDEVLAEFRAAEALLDGHFILSSGLRSPTYLQCARVLMDPKRAQRLCAELASRLTPAVHAGVTAVVSPAMGGVIDMTMRWDGIDLNRAVETLTGQEPPKGRASGSSSGESAASQRVARGSDSSTRVPSFGALSITTLPPDWRAMP